MVVSCIYLNRLGLRSLLLDLPLWKWVLHSNEEKQSAKKCHVLPKKKIRKTNQNCKLTKLLVQKRDAENATTISLHKPEGSHSKGHQIGASQGCSCRNHTELEWRGPSRKAKAKKQWYQDIRFTCDTFKSQKQSIKKPKGKKILTRI